MKRLFAMILCLALCLSLAACGGSDRQDDSSGASFNTSAPTEDTPTQPTSGKPGADDSKPSAKPEVTTPTQPNKTPNPTKPTKPVEPEETQPAPTKHTHSYTKTVVAPTCGAEGYTRYKCSCGNQYQENYTPQTYDHIFKKESKTLGGINYSAYICNNCGTEASEIAGYGTSGYAPFITFRYYLTYTPKVKNGSVEFENYHLVVTGNGAMTDFQAERILPGWYSCLEYVDKITVGGNLTSITQGAFDLPDSKKVEFEISGAVKTIHNNAINMKISTLVLGENVKTIKGNLCAGVNLEKAYLPKSLTSYRGFSADMLGNSEIYYEGSVEDFLKIKIDDYSDMVTVKDYIIKHYPSDATAVKWSYLYMNASKLGDKHEYCQNLKIW